MKWTESQIARELSTRFFDRKHLVMVPNCNWTGHEADILAITNSLRLIDIEIKISRSDLKADAKKDKWWEHPSFAWGEPRPDPVAREHPPKVWKHYYALPADIWTKELEQHLPNKSSGVLLLKEGREGLHITCFRQAKPAKDAYRLQPVEAINIARLASLRMWEAYRKLEEREAA